MEQMKTIRLNLSEGHLERLDEVGRALGHTSRSETMRCLILNAKEFTEGRLTGLGSIEAGAGRQRTPK